MLNRENVAVTVGRAVEAFRRGPDAVPEQKVALRALVGLMRLDGVVLRAIDGELWVADTQISPALPGVRSLLVQFEGHDVDEVHMHKDAAPASLLHLLRALATPLGGFPGDEGVDTHLRAAGVEDVTVLVRRRTGRPTGPAFPSPGVSAISEATTERVSLSAALRGGPRLSRPEAAVAALVLEPDHAEVRSHLATAAAHVGEELEHGRPSGAVRAVAQLIQLEETAIEARRAPIREAVRSLLDDSLLRGALGCAREEAVRVAAIRVLQRAGPAGTSLVRGEVLAATTPEDRASWFRVLEALPDGVRSLLLQLQARDGAVARRTAEVLGDLRVRDAVLPLARMAVSHDPGVRRAAAVGLARLATPDAIEAIADLLKAADREVRLDAARAVRGQPLADLIAPLEESARSESEPEALVVYGRALGRIGTPEAVEILARWTAAPGWRFWRRHTGLRLAGVDGLRSAGGAGARELLTALAGDRDADVRRAAVEALEDVSIAARPSDP